MASQPEPDPGDDLPGADDDGPLSARDRRWWQRRIAVKDGAIASLRRTVANLEERLEAAEAAGGRAQDDDDTLLLDFTHHYMEVNSGGRFVKEWHARQEALEQEYRDSRA